jgi:hypothetical protein
MKRVGNYILLQILSIVSVACIIYAVYNITLTNFYLIYGICLPSLVIVSTIKLITTHKSYPSFIKLNTGIVAVLIISAEAFVLFSHDHTFRLSQLLNFLALALLAIEFFMIIRHDSKLQGQ